MNYLNLSVYVNKEIIVFIINKLIPIVSFGLYILLLTINTTFF